MGVVDFLLNSVFKLKYCRLWHIYLLFTSIPFSAKGNDTPTWLVGHDQEQIRKFTLQTEICWVVITFIFPLKHTSQYRASL